ncbi:MAG: hypothetical protein ABWJ97_03395 [Thermoproteus sp.]
MRKVLIIPLVLLLAYGVLAAPPARAPIQINTAGSSGGDCTSLQLTLLNAQWASLPQYNGSSAEIALTFYSSCTYHAVTFQLVPQCPYVSAGQPAFVESIAANSIFTVALPLYANQLNVTCPLEVIATAQYGAGFSNVLDATGAYFLTAYVPPYPVFSASIGGAAYVGLPSRLALYISDPYAFPAQVSISGQSAAVLSPTSPISINGSAEIPVAVVPYSTSAALSVSIKSQDYMGNPVSYSYVLYIPASQPPSPTISITPSTLYLDQVNNVTISVSVPFNANGTAYVVVSGASTPYSPIVVPIRDGAGAATVRITPLQSAVAFQASIAYSVSGYQQTSQVSTTVAALQAPTALASLSVSPQILIANAANNLTLTVNAPGPFNAIITISGASTGVPMPIYISGVNTATYSLVLYPSSQQVSISATIQTGSGTQQYTVNLPATSSNIFLAVPQPTSVTAGGNRSVVVKLVNQGNIPVEKGVLVITPASSSPALMGTVVYNFSSLPPLGVVEVPISFVVPAGQTGSLPFQYTVYYMTPLGSGTAQGTFYVQAFQPPSILITSLSTSPQTPQPGSPFFVSITLVNNGFVPVNNLEISLKAPQGLTPITPTLNYIGSLSQQQSQTATFSLNATRPGRYDLALVVTYQDQYGNTYNQTAQLSVTVGGNFTGRFGNFTRFRTSTTNASGGIASIAVVAAVVAIAAVLIAVGIWRRRK